MTLRKDGSWTVPFCVACKRPVWKWSLAKFHEKKKGHKNFVMQRVRVGQYKTVLRGPDHPLARLGPKQVEKIRELWFGKRPPSLSTLGKMFDTSPSNIWLIVAGKSWKHTNKRKYKRRGPKRKDFSELVDKINQLGLDESVVLSLSTTSKLKQGILRRVQSYIGKWRQRKRVLHRLRTTMLKDGRISIVRLS